MGHHFSTTAWSVIAAARGHDSVAARGALGTLCGRYWPPLYAYLRRKGYDPEEAEDLTQGFFVCLLERDLLQRLEPGRGRFRTYLLTCLNYYLHNEWDRRTAVKRGGTSEVLSLDFHLAEERYRPLDPSTAEPTLAFDRQWAETLLDNAVARLEAEYRISGQSRAFQVLGGFLGRGREQASYAAAAEALGVTEGAARVAVHRLRKRFHALVREEIAATVNDPDEVQEELAYLIRVMRA